MRGQGATEYLIILAIVIIIGLIVIGVLRNVPSTGTAAAERAAKSFWDTAEIGISNWAIDSSGAVLYLRNNQDGLLTITNIKLGSTTVYTTDFALSPGETKAVTGSAVTCTAGNPFSYTVEIDYTIGLTGADYTYKGSNNPIVGVCAN